MKDKEKQISKNKEINNLANTLYNRQHKYDLSNPFEVAKCVIDLGYRKLPEGARVFIPTDEQYIVLSKEEYEILTKDIEHPTDEVLKKLIVGKNMLVEKAIEDTRKETAEKILKWFRENYDGNMFFINIFFKEQFGVEIKE